MRNTKKLMLLLLSLALLCGIFAVTALAKEEVTDPEEKENVAAIVDNGLVLITNLELGETIFDFKEITKANGSDSISLYTIGSDKVLFQPLDGTALRFVLVTDDNGIDRDIEAGEKVTEDLLGKRIAIMGGVRESTKVLRIKAIVWEADGEHYNYIANSKNTDNLIRELFAAGYVNNGHKLTLYNDVTYNSSSGNAFKGTADTNSYVDLNGYTLTIENTTASSPALNLQAGALYMYSSRPDGKLVANSPYLFGSSGSTTPSYFGEDDDDTTDYAANFTVEAPSFSQMSYAINILGGTYVQPEGATADYFLSQVGAGITVKNATFIIKGTINKGFFGSHTGAITTSQDAPVTVISENPIKLAFHANNGTGAAKATFNAWNFYNVEPNVETNVAYSYSNCRFNASYENPLASGVGRIAFDGNPITLTVDGEEYTFGATMVAKADTALVNWGFGIEEYWKIGVTATHANVVVDDLFNYAFAPLTVAADGNNATYTLDSLVSGVMRMSLTLQSKIGVNVFFTEALADATVKFGGEEIALAGLVAENGFYKLSAALAPNVANLAYDVTIVIGDNKHVISLSIGTYAEKILASDAYANVHNLTYAMVEYVRAMTGDADFLATVAAPTGYEAQTPGEATYEKGENVLLSGLRFNLSGTIALELAGTENAEGLEVTLVLANGRTETATVDENGSAVFAGLYVNDFAGEMEISVGGEVYSYSIENYYNALDAQDSKEAIAALYNYAQYAAAYVELLQNAD